MLAVMIQPCITADKFQNAVFHLLRTKGPEHWFAAANQAKRQEPLSYMIKIQVKLGRRVYL